MDKEAWIKAHLGKKKGVCIDFKVEWDCYRFMIFEKMFVMLGQNKQHDNILTLKLSPQECAFYRETYEYITEGYYMNKVHWISVLYKQASHALLEELMDKSYDNFLHTLTKKQQALIDDI